VTPPEPPEPGRAAGRIAAFALVCRAAWRAMRNRERIPPGVGGPEYDESDIDPSERKVPSNRRAETLVAILLLLAAACGFGFTAIYAAASANTQLLGLAMALTLGLLAAAAIVAGKFVVPQETHVEERDTLLKEEETEEMVGMIEEGGQGISRRVLLTGAGGLAGAGLVTALVTPAASLGPTLNGIHGTQWQRGVRLVDDQGKPYKPEDIELGSFYTALPDHGNPEHFDAGLLVVKLTPQYLHLPPQRRDWAPEGVVAYSKICPHAGCAISLYRYPTYQPTSIGPAFTCPCHYSTFAPGEGGRLIFGPAGRSLPQLPLMVDAEGYLAAAGPFHEDIGPSWWNVQRGES
jgi:ubiquinol-cytochrome c reductase iron-sulfur subunit